MGNCLVMQETAVVKIKNTDEVLEYKAPIQVHQVLSEYSGHAISDTLPVLQHLQPQTRLLGGQLYYMVQQIPKVWNQKKKNVGFSNPEMESEKESGGMRIKLVISKHQLHEILQKGGVSVDEIVSKIESKKKIDAEDLLKGSDACQGWKPVLESIPEVEE